MTIKVDKTITQIAKFASKDQGRPGLAQVLIDPANGRAVSTDGHRLQMVDLPSGNEDMDSFGVLAAELLKMKTLATISACDDTITLTSVTTPTSVTTLAQVEAKFPDYQQVLPKDNTVILAVNAKYLAEAASYIAKHASNKKNPVAHLTVKINADGTVDATLPMTLEGVVGEDHRAATHVLMPVRV